MANYNTSEEIEIAVAGYFGIRTCLVVPNVSWGLTNYECDIVVLTPASCLYEIEIKISKSDLIADKKKRHGHYSDIIKELYFAMPFRLLNNVEHVPDRAGILIVHESGRVELKRKPELNKFARKLTEKERYQLARLGTMRIWRLKKRLLGKKGF